MLPLGWRSMTEREVPTFMLVSMLTRDHRLINAAMEFFQIAHIINEVRAMEYHDQEVVFAFEYENHPREYPILCTHLLYCLNKDPELQLRVEEHKN